MRRACLAAAAAAVLLAACAKKEEPKAPPKDPLEETTSQIINTRPCSVTIPAEWAPSLPVPALEDSKLVYKVFFAGWEGNAKDGIWYHGAEGDATFTPDGAILSCTRRGGQPAKHPARPVQGMTDEQWEQAQHQVYAETAKIAAQYAAGKADPAQTAAYSAAFKQVADPADAASYRALSPAFWAWVEAHGGTGPEP